jgi:hypothetical protein
MKTKTARKGRTAELLDEEIRDYAYHLYEQSGCVPGHDLDHWLEAKACILANIPRQQVRNRLHRHLENAAGR